MKTLKNYIINEDFTFNNNTLVNNEQYVIFMPWGNDFLAYNNIYDKDPTKCSQIDTRYSRITGWILPYSELIDNIYNLYDTKNIKLDNKDTHAYLIPDKHDINKVIDDFKSGAIQTHDIEKEWKDVIEEVKKI